MAAWFVITYEETILEITVYLRLNGNDDNKSGF